MKRHPEFVEGLWLPFLCAVRSSDFAILAERLTLQIRLEENSPKFISVLISTKIKKTIILKPLAFGKQQKQVEFIF